MPDRTETSRIPRIVIHTHTDRGGTYTCAGLLAFSSEDDDERHCYVCGLKESYDPTRFYIIAREGITQEELRQFCVYIGLQVENISPDKSNAKILAALVSLISGSGVSDPELWMDEKCKEANDEKWTKGYETIVMAICRKLVRSYGYVPKNS